eukprot:gene14514-20544_t
MFDNANSRRLDFEPSEPEEVYNADGSSIDYSSRKAAARQRLKQVASCALPEGHGGDACIPDGRSSKRQAKSKPKQDQTANSGRAAERSGYLVGGGRGRSRGEDGMQAKQ